eukprot:scaffold12233_cov64-Cylindrotheca_fusiformis.AAC.1
MKSVGRSSFSHLLPDESVTFETSYSQLRFPRLCSAAAVVEVMQKIWWGPFVPSGSPGLGRIAE